MPKPRLFPKDEMLETEIMETMRAGLHRWRSDLDFPESASDMQACIRGLLVMFEVTRRPLPVDLPVPCTRCEGLGYIIGEVTDNGSSRTAETCTRCKGFRRDPEYVGQ